MARPPFRHLAAVLGGALAAGCAQAPARPGLAGDEPSPRHLVDIGRLASGSSVAFALEGAPPFGCRVEIAQLAPATFALSAAEVVTGSKRAQGLEAVTVALDGERPVLVLRVSAPLPGPMPRDRFCAWAQATATAPNLPSSPGAREPPATLLWALEPDPGRVHYRAIQRITRGDRTLGFNEYAAGYRADGTRVYVVRGASLVRWNERWLAYDTVSVEETDGHGMLRRGRYLRLGERPYRIELRREAGGTFVASGSVGDRPLEARFEAPNGIATTLRRMELLSSRAGGGPAGPVQLDMYLPGVDASRPTPTTLRPDRSRPRGFVIERSGRASTCAAHPDGAMDWMEEDGTPPTRLETIWRRGEA